MSRKGLWRNTLPDLQLLYENKLYRPQRDGSPFVPYRQRKRELYQDWRLKPWNEERLRRYVTELRPEDKALLKILAEAGGGLQQHSIMENVPFLRGRSSASLRALKSHVNAGCKALDCAPLLAEGSGTGDFRIHEINPALGALRTVVMQEAKEFDIPWHLLERPAPNPAPRAATGSTRNRVSAPGKRKAWYVLQGDSGRLIAAFVDAKGAYSCRLYRRQFRQEITRGRLIPHRLRRADSRWFGIQAALPAGSGCNGNARASCSDCQCGHPRRTVSVNGCWVGMDLSKSGHYRTERYFLVPVRFTVGLQTAPPEAVSRRPS